MIIIFVRRTQPYVFLKTKSVKHVTKSFLHGLHSIKRPKLFLDSQTSNDSFRSYFTKNHFEKQMPKVKIPNAFEKYMKVTVKLSKLYSSARVPDMNTCKPMHPFNPDIEKIRV